LAGAFAQIIGILSRKNVSRLSVKKLWYFQNSCSLYSINTVVVSPLTVHFCLFTSGGPYSFWGQAEGEKCEGQKSSFPASVALGSAIFFRQGVDLIFNSWKRKWLRRHTPFKRNRLDISYFWRFY
jgi:uncharacterized protein with PQ loop repeat